MSLLTAEPAEPHKPAEPSTPAEAQRRERILLASQAVFAQRGFEAPTMDELAQACGCTRRTLYRAFASKEELFWAGAVLAYQGLARLLRQTQAVWESAGVATRGRIRSWSHAYLDYSLAEPAAFRMIMQGRERAVGLALRATDGNGDPGCAVPVPGASSHAALAALDQEVLGALRSLGQGLESEGLAPAGQGQQRLWELLATVISLVEFHARYQGGGQGLPFGSSEGIRRLIDFQIETYTTTGPAARSAEPGPQGAPS